MKPTITIIGAGESGTSAALLAQRQGYHVVVSSSNPIAEKYKADLVAHKIVFEEGHHAMETILAATLIVKSPGVDPHIEPLRQARSKKIEIIDEIEFAFRYIRGKLIAISGTNGKTTTASLTYHLLKTAGMHVALAGNIGKSLSRVVMEEPRDCYVVEVSSFQLDGIKTFKPDIAVLLNITPDHLDRYNHILQHYIDAKFRLIRNTTDADYFIYYADDERIQNELLHRSIRAKQLGITLTGSTQAVASFDGSTMNFSIGNDTFEMAYQPVPLTGPHNSINTMAAVLAAYTAGAPLSAIREGLSTFTRSPHRLECVATIRGVQFINDSKATNVDAVLQALNSYDAPLVWVAGGVDKGNEYEPLHQLVCDKVKALICLGKDNAKLKAHFAGMISSIDETEDIHQAVNMAWEAAQDGYIVLLAPACASFDLFENYEDRGNQFIQAVRMLEHNIKNTVGS